jgi:class 3 adenylate cyclase
MSPKRGSSVLVTVLFTDIVGSTEIAAELKDRRWRDLVQRHHAVVRRELKRAGGKELDTAGDGFFASFQRPADAIRCACRISDEVRELGLEIRAGLHLGEAEILEGKVGGIAVNVGARVMGVAKGGEVLVSSTLRDAVAGSGFDFADHGTHRLKGIEGEWRLYEVTSLDGARRSLPLTAEESRTRREFTEAIPVHRRRDRVLAGVAGGLVVALVVAGGLTNALGGGDAPAESGLSQAERSLRALVPENFRSSCSRSSSPTPNAIASLDCVPSEAYSVTYASFGSADGLRTAFEAFASPADLTNIDCSRDGSGRHAYTVNGTVAGEVACYTNDGTGIGSSDSVIVWTDDELLVLGRAVRGDAADLTLYLWWTTEAGPWEASSANPPKDSEPAHILQGEFEAAGGDTWTLTFEDGRYEESEFGPIYGDAEPLFAKPSTLLLYHRLPPPTFGGALCPNYEEYRWRLRGERLSLDLVSGGCREYSSVEIANAEWTRVP